MNLLPQLPSIKAKVILEDIASKSNCETLDPKGNFKVEGIFYVPTGGQIINDENLEKLRNNVLEKAKEYGFPSTNQKSFLEFEYEVAKILSNWSYLWIDGEPSGESFRNDLNELFKKEGIEYLLEKLGLSKHRTKKMRELSGGMKRRLQIAKALVHDPEIIILDEPTAGVDVELRHDLWLYLQELHKDGKTILLTTHYIDEAELLCERVGIIDKGKLIVEDLSLIHI